MSRTADLLVRYVPVPVEPLVCCVGVLFGMPASEDSSECIFMSIGGRMFWRRLPCSGHEEHHGSIGFE